MANRKIDPGKVMQLLRSIEILINEGKSVDKAFHISSPRVFFPKNYHKTCTAFGGRSSLVYSSELCPPMCTQLCLSF